MKILALILLLCSFGASAQTTIYYQRCDTGAHANCSTLTGSDSNDGLSISAPKTTLPSNDAVNALAAGSNIRLCNGGAWVDSNAIGWQWQNANVTRTNRITVEGYDCGNGATGRPILQFTSGTGAGMNFGGFNGNPATPSADNGGYVIRGIRLTRSGSPGGTGFSFFGSTRWSLFDNVRVDNWANGMEVVTTENIRNLTIKDSIISDNCQNGIIGAGTDLVVEGSTFENNNPASAGCGTYVLQHGVYIGGATAQNRITFRNNVFRNNSLTSGVCGSGNATFRGIVDQFTFEGNTIETPGGNSQCIGLSIQDGYGGTAECVRRAVIRGNTIIDGGSSGMLLRITPGALIENNRIIMLATSGTQNGINIANPGGAEDISFCPAADTVVRNNSSYYSSGSGGVGISVNAGSGHQVFNNLMHITAGSGLNCFATAGGTFTLWDYNWCYELGSGQYSATYTTRALACSGATFDCNGGTADPLLSAAPTAIAPSMALQSGSPLRSAGRNTNKAVRDVLWCQRDGTPDIGAHEFGGTPCLTVRSPVGVR